MGFVLLLAFGYPLPSYRRGDPLQTQRCFGAFWNESFEGERSISAKGHRVNEAIRVKQVRLIGADGKHLGLVPVQEAIRAAYEKELDLVEVSPSADPPVCRIMDYGKFLYEQAKKEREAKKAQKQIEVKEIRLRPKTDGHHVGFKVRDAERWLQQGMKVKVRVRFRGREITYPDLARDQLLEIAQELSEAAIVEQQPNMEGRTMLMVLAPMPKKKSSSKKETTHAEDQNSQSNV